MKITCPNCRFDREVDEATLPARAAMATCPKCKHRFKFRELPATMFAHAQVIVEHERPEPRKPNVEEQPAVTPPQPSPDEDLWTELESLNDDADHPEGDTPDSEPTVAVLPAWEKAQGGYPQALVQTFLDVLANPKTFFRTMPVGLGFLKPLLFFLILVEVVAISQAMWQLFGIVPPSALTEGLGHNLQAAIALVLYPVEVTVFLVLDATINHIFLRLFRADTKGFEGTFRASTYSAAPMLLMIVPYIGLPLAMIGGTVYKYLGLRYVHGASPKQVIAALTVPMLLTVAIAVLGILLTGGV